MLRVRVSITNSLIKTKEVEGCQEKTKIVIKTKIVRNSLGKEIKKKSNKGQSKSKTAVISERDDKIGSH